MTDIDFDELDKAVTSLMGKAVSTDPDDIVQEKNLNISSTLKPGEKPLYDKLGEAARGIGSETLLTEGERTVMGDSKLPTTELPIAELDAIQSGQVAVTTFTQPAAVAAPAVKRPTSGRAMDVVRSSPSKPIAPTMPSLVAPDRLFPQPSVVSEPIASPEQTPVATSENNDSQRLTPFLPDTKVEKRPLGGSGSSSDSASPLGAVESPFGSESSEKEAPEPTQDEVAKDDSAVTQPEVVETEVKKQDDSQKNIDANDVETKLSPEEQKLQEVESAEAVEDAQTAESVRAVESGDTEKLNNGSIAQQYKTKPSEPSDTAGAIYDVKDYHQALGHPKKQKSGWGTIILILVIIIACALIGAAVYFILGAGL